MGENCFVELNTRLKREALCPFLGRYLEDETTIANYKNMILIWFETFEW